MTSAQKITKTLSRTRYVAPISESILSVLEPLTKALDDNAFLVGGEGESGDTGHELPSTKDISIRIVLGRMCQMLYDQTCGTINTGGARQILNAKDRMYQSDMDLAAHQKRYAGEDGEPDFTMMAGDPRTYKLQYWCEVNNTRFHAYQELLDQFKLVYKAVTREDWVPMNNTNSPVKKIDPSTLSDEQRERLETAMKKQADRLARRA